MKNFTGYTLAEVLITIAVIGIVAAITMPILTREISMKVDSSREANIALKITKAMENMSVAGELGMFNSTDEFVDVLQKYLKIVKRCDAEHLTDCWPSNTVVDSTGKNFEVKDAKLGTDLHVKGNTTDNVGLVLADGASIILTYNQDFKGYSHDTFFAPISKTLPIGFGKEETFKYYTSNVTAPIDFVMDVNGSSPPNQETEDGGIYHDIRSFRTASFSSGACPANGKRLNNGMCMVVLSGFEPVSCASSLSEDYQYCDDYYLKQNYSQDYWAGSKKACADLGMEYAEPSLANNIIKEGFAGDGDFFNSCVKADMSPCKFRKGHYYNANGINEPTTKVICVK